MIDEGLWNVYRNLDGQPGGVRIQIGETYLGGWYISNNGSAARYIKLYDQETVPQSTDVPQMTILVPAQGAANILSNAAIMFEKGMGIRVTTGRADTDTGAPTAGDVVVNLFYR